VCSSDLLRHTSLIQFNRGALEATGAAVIALAESEGLHSHAESVRRRLDGNHGD
jgi:histidinol dehydrogenase